MPACFACQSELRLSNQASPVKSSFACQIKLCLSKQALTLQSKYTAKHQLVHTKTMNNSSTTLCNCILQIYLQNAMHFKIKPHRTPSHFSGISSASHPAIAKFRRKKLLLDFSFLDQKLIDLIELRWRKSEINCLQTPVLDILAESTNFTANSSRHWP